MDSVLKPITDSAERYVIDFVGRQIRYLINCSDNVQKLQTAVKELKATRDGRAIDLTRAECAGQVKTPEASIWFEEVKEIEKEELKIQGKYEQAGWCVNFWSRIELSRKAEELKREADSRKAEKFELTRPAPVESAVRMEIKPMENYLSTQPKLKETLVWMDSMESGIIGIYGMGGVGKTTLAKKVNNHFIDNPRFQTVIMVTVSQNPNIQNIRTRISERLGLDLKDARTDDAEREKLSGALSKKKFLLILDDVWSELELNVVGIPHPGNHTGSMILMTSRRIDTCLYMSAQSTIKVDPLSDGDSFDLFIQIVGTHIKGDDRIEALAKKIAGRCGGLPLAINTVAHAMKNHFAVAAWEDAHAMKNHFAVAAWEDAARDLDNLRDMQEKVLEPLKFSYDRLGDDKLQSLFLYCACFPEDYNIRESEILNYCAGEGFVDSVGSLKAAMDRVKSMISSLKIVCMLEDGEDEGSVRMHDMMRELALSITSPKSSDRSSPKFLIRLGESTKVAPQVDDWVDATTILFIRTDIEEVPELGESCRKLTTLLLWGESISTIPQTNFFQHMEHLKILHLWNLYMLSNVPDSLSCLVNLRVLRIRSCYDLESLPALGKLQHLQVLELRDFNSAQQIFTLEECAAGLSNLRYLDLSKSAVSIPVGSISLLLKLETLILRKTPAIGWKVSENGKWYESNDHGNLDVEELFHLRYLTTFDVNFKGIIISDWIIPLVEKIRDLVLDNCTATKQDCLQALIGSRSLRKVEMIKCSNLRCAPYFVESLLIESCKGFEKVLNGVEVDQDAFQRLVTLLLYRLPNLERICVGLVPKNCFGKLKVLRIEKCPKLKNIITKEMVRMLNNLEEVRVSDCTQVEVIIEAQEEGSTVNGLYSPFPKLKRFCIVCLPALVDLCSNHILHCPQIEYMTMYDCPQLKKDPLQIRNTKGFIIIKGHNGWEKGDKVQEEEIQEV